MRELVHAVAGLATEQPRQFAVCPRQQMHGKMRRILGDAIGVVLVRQADEKSRWSDADLAGEPDQAARPTVAGAVVTTYIG